MPKWHGLGIACSHYVSGSAKPVHWTGEPHATVVLKLDFDGGITILTGASDIGQGSSTVLTQVVIEVLGVDQRRIRVIANDSAVTPKDNGSYSSRVTFMVGNAALHAARNLKELLIKAAAQRLQVAPEQVESLGECFRTDQPPGAEISFGDAVAQALVDTGTLFVKGTYTCPAEFQGGKQRGGAVGSTMGFSYAAQVVEVAVDPDTGQVRTEKVWVALDCGYAINPLSVEGQVQGAVWMGMGQAMSEQTRFDKGKPMAANILDYAVPTMVDSPPIDVQLVESMDPNGPFGAKEGSEGPLSGFPAAFAAAVRQATGIGFHRLPITPDVVLDAILAQESTPATVSQAPAEAPARTLAEKVI
jgi:4-hydroxybenzoyl-CoA reductase subunit alpha